MSEAPADLVNAAIGKNFCAAYTKRKPTAEEMVAVRRIWSKTEVIMSIKNRNYHICRDEEAVQSFFRDFGQSRYQRINV